MAAEGFFRAIGRIAKSIEKAAKKANTPPKPPPLPPRIPNVTIDPKTWEPKLALPEITIPDELSTRAQYLKISGEISRALKLAEKTRSSVEARQLRNFSSYGDRAGKIDTLLDRVEYMLNAYTGDVENVEHRFRDMTYAYQCIPTQGGRLSKQEKSVPYKVVDACELDVLLEAEENEWMCDLRWDDVSGYHPPVKRERTEKG